MSGCYPAVGQINFRANCTCKCHVSQGEHCRECIGLSFKMRMDGVPPVFPRVPEETITIKKALWDEMLSYKERIELLEDEIEYIKGYLII